MLSYTSIPAVIPMAMMGVAFALVPAISRAHHITVNDSKRRMMVASLRYLDTFVKTDGTWLFSERLLYVDWTEERPLS